MSGCPDWHLSQFITAESSQSFSVLDIFVKQQHIFQRDLDEEYV